MALLFIKQKLFPERRTKLSQPNYRKPLLSTDEDEDEDDTIINSSGSMEHDVEGQRSRAYHTFRDSSPSSSNYDVESTGSSNTRSRIDPRIVSDAILGLSDGLTVPFALSAGLSALGDTKVVVLGGLAELAAGAISMGLGGYVGAKSEARESYQTTVRETTELIDSSPSETQAIVYGIFASHGVPDDAIAPIITSLHASRDRLREFLITFHHKESEPDCNQAWTSAITLALGYFIGGFIPLIPYFFLNQVLIALYCSVAVMAVTLLVFGYIKTAVVRGWRGKDNVLAGVKGGIQMVVVGAFAAGAAIGLVRLINGGS